MRCAIKCIKCITDPILSSVNCVGFPILALLAWGKSDEWGVLDKIEWSLIWVPLFILLLLNLLYCMCCKLLLKNGRVVESQDSVV